MLLILGPCALLTVRRPDLTRGSHDSRVRSGNESCARASSPSPSILQMFSSLKIGLARPVARYLTQVQPPRLPLTARLQRFASTGAPSTPPAAAVLPPRPPKHKGKKAKASSKSPTTPSLTVAALSPSTPSIPSLLPLGLHKNTSSKPADGQAVALTSAERYDTAALLKSLQALGLLDGAVNLLGEAILLPRWSPQPGVVGEVFIFESGTIVTWGLGQAGTEAFLRKVIRGSVLGVEELGWVEQGRYTEPETEVLDFWVGKK